MLMNAVIYYANLERDGDGTAETVENRFGTVPAVRSYLQKQLCNDSSALAKFPAWWGNYFRSVSKEKYDSVSVVKTYVYSTPPYNKPAYDSLIFTIKLR